MAPENKIIDDKTLVIKNDIQKITIYLTSDKSREGHYDFKVRTYGDGYMDDKAGARPFKQVNFSTQNSQINEKNAMRYFNERVAFYEKKLGVSAQLTEVDKIVGNIKSLKDKIFGNSTDNNHKIK